MNRRRSNDEHLNRYHPHVQPFSYKFQQGIQQRQHEDFNTVARYHSKPLSTSIFHQSPRLISQTTSVSVTRPSYTTPSYLTRDSERSRNQAASGDSTWHTIKNHTDLNDNHHSTRTPEVKTVIEVSETAILDDAIRKDEEKLLDVSGSESHEGNSSIRRELT